VPPWQHIQLFSIRAEAADINKASGSTIDQQNVDTDLTVRYNIKPDKVAEVYEQYSHDGDLQSYVQTATQETFKAVTARYTAPELISKRTQVSTDIRTLLQSKLDTYGANVINIDMRNFEFSAEYKAAINQKVTQEQLRQVADNKLKTVESEQRQKVAIAEAEANALKAAADGNAYAAVGGSDRGVKRVVVESPGAGSGAASAERRAREEQGRAGAAPHRGGTCESRKVGRQAAGSDLCQCTDPVLECQR
jgi:regulator of protease activity HflC (stomatin/prohibitin superfamily)